MEKISFEFKNIDEKELKNLVENLVKCLKGNEIFLLVGNLGAGKTTFVKHLVSSIDEDLEDEVNSPTFVVMNVYESKNFNIYHIDLYRVKDFDLTDIVGNGMIFIEWAKIKEFEGINLPVITVNLEIGEDINKRNIKIEVSNGDYLKRCLDSLGDRK